MCLEDVPLIWCLGLCESGDTGRALLRLLWGFLMATKIRVLSWLPRPLRNYLASAELAVSLVARLWARDQEGQLVV